MSVSTCVAICIGSFFIALGISDLSNKGKSRNEYDDYVQAVLGVCNLTRSSFREDSGFERFDQESSKRLNDLKEGLIQDLRNKFLGGINGR